MINDFIIPIVTIIFSAGVAYGVVKASMKTFRDDIDKLQLESVNRNEWEQALSNITKAIEEVKEQNQAIDAKRELSTITHQETLQDIRHFMGRVEEFMSSNRIN